MPKNTERLQIHPYVYASVFSSASIILGLLWDVSWHMSVGRDTFFSPPHIGIYLGSVLSATYSGYLIIYNSFWASPDNRKSRIKFWWVFYGHTGELFSIWGALAMLTAAPLDDWWHNTFGLDLFILSPPHVLLFSGMIMIQFGAMLTTLPAAREAAGRSKLWYQRLFIFSAGLVVATLYTLFSDILNKAFSHSAVCYLVAAIAFPLFLIAVRRASGMRWAATGTACVYMGLFLFMLWLMPVFPVTPRLGPILTSIDHYQPFHFPLLLVLPALAIDTIFSRSKLDKPYPAAILASVAFMLIFFIVQWNFGTFLHTSVLARNWFFGSYSWYFGAEPDYKYRYEFNPAFTSTGFSLWAGAALACLIAALSGSMGYKLGEWMKRIQR